VGALALYSMIRLPSQIIGNTKRGFMEEIREELAKRRYYDGMVGIGSGIPRWEDRTEVEREHFREKIDSDFQYLHSRGCVLKVDRELPTFYTSKMPTCERGLECSFVEPLIEEDELLWWNKPD